MNLIEEIKETLSLEIRPNSQGWEYLEAVVDRMELESLQTILTKHLGPAAKQPGENKRFPKEIQRIVDELGGLRTEQSFFYRKDATKVVYAALWPWQSDPRKITLKSGIGKIGEQS